MTVSGSSARELLVRYLRPQAPRVSLVFAMMLGQLAIQIGLPLLVGDYINKAAATGPTGILFIIACSFIALSIVNQLVQLATAYFGETVAWQSTNALRSDLFDHVLNLDLSFYEDHRIGEIVERVDDDVTALTSFFSDLVMGLLGSVLLVMGIIVALLVENYLIGLLFLGFSFVVLVVLKGLSDYASAHWEIARQAKADFFGFIGEALQGIEDIRGNGAVGHILRRLSANTWDLLAKQRPAYIRSRALWPGMLALLGGGYALIFLLGFHLLHRGAITIGTVFLMFYYLNMISIPLQSITLQMEDFQRATASIRRILRLFHFQGSTSINGSEYLPEGALSVGFRQVSYGYAYGQRALDGVNFELASGMSLGVIGRTGSGKTTMTRLLLRLASPQDGVVSLGGCNIANVARKDLLSRVSIVTQRVKLFRASVRDNVTLFDTTISDQKIVLALEEMGLGGWLAGLPDGLDTVLEGETGGLSAGQAQLLAFARVFLSNPGLVILDEASSRLDPMTERMLDSALTKLFVGRTTIVIAHRLHTVRMMDWILSLEDGRVVEFGKRSDLEGNPMSRFGMLVREYASKEEQLR